MNKIRIDVVHRYDSDTPSVKNLLQGLNGVKLPLDIKVHSLHTGLPGQNKFISGIELGITTVKSFVNSINVKLQSDILIIHKSLDGLIDRVSDINLSERLFLLSENVI